MGKVLVIGAATPNIIIELDHLPVTSESVPIKSQEMVVGGCPFNASEILHGLGEPYELFTPIGTGPYGDYIRDELARIGVVSRVPPTELEEGCCYCLVEPSGERSFICRFGAEFSARAEWFDVLDMDEFDFVYICGFEINQPTGEVIVEFLEEHARDRTIFFAPGGLVDSLPVGLVERICDLHAIFHLNAREVRIGAERFGGVRPGDVEEASRTLNRRTGNLVVATMGADGCWYETGSARGLVPGVHTDVVDTIGAGDSHVGTLMTYLHRGASLEEALAKANRVAARVVATRGPHLSGAELGRAVAGE